MLFAKLCAIFEPYGIHRKIIGFDTFKGFPNIDKQRDQSSNPKFKKNTLEVITILFPMSYSKKL